MQVSTLRQVNLSLHTFRVVCVFCGPIVNLRALMFIIGSQYSVN